MRDQDVPGYAGFVQAIGTYSPAKLAALDVYDLETVAQNLLLAHKHADGDAKQAWAEVHFLGYAQKMAYHPDYDARLRVAIAMEQVIPLRPGDAPKSKPH